MTKEKNKTTKLVVSIILAVLVAIAGVVTGVLLFRLAILPVQYSGCGYRSGPDKNGGIAWMPAKPHDF